MFLLQPLRYVSGYDRQPLSPPTRLCFETARDYTTVAHFYITHVRLEMESETVHTVGVYASNARCTYATATDALSASTVEKYGELIGALALSFCPGFYDVRASR